jgi:hypothetical protein
MAKPPEAGRSAERDKRLAEALRANLRRRKQRPERPESPGDDAASRPATQKPETDPP